LDESISPDAHSIERQELAFAAKPMIAAADGTVAGLITIAMTFGLIEPKMCIEHFFRIRRNLDRIAGEPNISATSLRRGR
jgi:hypothetical protein